MKILSVRNYECPTCHKKFSRSYYLTDHLKVFIEFHCRF